MPRITITTEWTADYDEVRGEVYVGHASCEGVPQPAKRVPEVVDELLQHAAEEDCVRRIHEALEANDELKHMQREGK